MPINKSQRTGLMSKTVSVDLEPGEAFFRVSVDEEGVTNFACGFYPTNMNIEKDFNEEEDIDYDDMLTVFMAGITHMIKEEMDNILHRGMESIIKGNKPFDFIVDPADMEFYSGLSDEQLKLLRMDTEGEA
jgi:hypothetical protein